MSQGKTIRPARAVPLLPNRVAKEGSCGFRPSRVLRIRYNRERFDLFEWVHTNQVDMC